MGTLGATLLALILIFAVGNLWFHLVEWVLKGFRRWLNRRKEPGVWHTLPTEEEDSHNV